MNTVLVTSKQYSQHVVERIHSAKHRVFALSMILQQDKAAQHIVTALNRAAHRGVIVDVMGDAGTQHYTDGSFSPVSAFKNQADLTYNITNRLRSSSVSFRWLGIHSPFLFAGRTHSKWIVIDDTVYTFGGINLHDGFESETDFMLYIKDAQLAEHIVYEHQSIKRADNNHCAYISTEVTSEHGTVLIDGGIPGDSLIYRKATELARTATHVLMVTQYCPTGRLARALHATDSSVYYNPVGSADFLTNSFIHFGKKMHNIENNYTGSKYIHAKFMIATMPDGTKQAITGSHNFVSYGGLLGTREIALLTDNHEVIEQLEDFHRRYVA